MLNNHVVIIAGGVGSRFWPLSTPDLPKQFIDILGCGKTLLQLTMQRFRNICPIENFWVVTNVSYVDIVRQQLPEILENHILAEPEARNTAPCIAWACWNIYMKYSFANIVITPADALVVDNIEFHRVINNALEFTKNHKAIVTIGIKPSRAEIGYGYVEMTDLIQGEIYCVQSFKEKPNINTAKYYLDSGKYLWNAGIFVWNINTIINCIKIYCPELSNNMEELIKTGDINRIFPLCQKISIDYAVMEPAAVDGIVFTHPADFGWSDLGNWASLHEKMAKDINCNSAIGTVEFYECDNCIAHLENVKRAVLQGLSGYIVAEKNGQFLICKRTEEQRIREFSVS